MQLYCWLAFLSLPLGTRSLFTVVHKIPAESMRTPSRGHNHTLSLAIPQTRDSLERLTIPRKIDRAGLSLVSATALMPSGHSPQIEDKY